MRWIFLLSLSFLYADPTIVFLHVGSSPPPLYVREAFHQARLFNPECPIYFVTEKRYVVEVKEACHQYDVTIATVDHFQRHPFHRLFARKQLRAMLEMDEKVYHFFGFAAERFFYLYEFMDFYKVEELVAVENDVMLYVDVKEIWPIFRKSYPGMAATFDTSSRAVPGLVYIAKRDALLPLLQNIMLFWDAPNFVYEMEMMAKVRRENGSTCIDHLPIIFPEYVAKEGLRDVPKVLHIPRSRLEISLPPYPSTTYMNHLSDFQMIFDAAALGQCLGGTHGHSDWVGFSNPHCVFDAAKLEYEWRENSQGLKVPFIRYGEGVYPVANLHIHSKQLERFLSDR